VLFRSSSNDVYSLVDSSGVANATFTFTGAKDSTYCFLTIAVDSVGNTEVKQQKSPCIVLDTIPQIFDFTPKVGIPFTEVTIDGWNFAGLSSILFNGNEAEVIDSTDSKIIAKAPYPGSTGPITVITTKGTAVSDSVFTYEDPTGAGQVKESKIILYPNTTGGVFKVSTRAERLPSGILYVYDANGRIIKEVDFTQLRDNETVVDISHMPKGIYFVRLIGKDKTFTSRIIKK